MARICLTLASCHHLVQSPLSLRFRWVPVSQPAGLGRRLSGSSACHASLRTQVLIPNMHIEAMLLYVCNPQLWGGDRRLGAHWTASLVGKVSSSPPTKDRSDIIDLIHMIIHMT